jgi:hypothetical protein
MIKPRVEIIATLLAIILTAGWFIYGYNLYALVRNIFVPISYKLYSASCNNGGKIVVELKGKSFGSQLFDIEHSPGENLWINLWYVSPTGEPVPFETRETPDPVEGYNFDAAHASKAPAHIPPDQLLVVDERGVGADPKDTRIINVHISHNLLNLNEYKALQYCFDAHSSELVRAIFERQESDASFHGWLAKSIGILYYDKETY